MSMSCKGVCCRIYLLKLSKTMSLLQVPKLILLLILTYGAAMMRMSLSHLVLSRRFKLMDGPPISICTFSPGLLSASGCGFTPSS